MNQPATPSPQVNFSLATEGWLEAARTKTGNKTIQVLLAIRNELNNANFLVLDLSEVFSSPSNRSRFTVKTSKPKPGQKWFNSRLYARANLKLKDVATGKTNYKSLYLPIANTYSYEPVEDYTQQKWLPFFSVPASHVYDLARSELEITARMFLDQLNQDEFNALPATEKNALELIAQATAAAYQQLGFRLRSTNTVGRVSKVYGNFSTAAEFNLELENKAGMLQVLEAVFNPNTDPEGYQLIGEIVDRYHKLRANLDSDLNNLDLYSGNYWTALTQHASFPTIASRLEALAELHGVEYGSNDLNKILSLANMVCHLINQICIYRISQSDDATDPNVRLFNSFSQARKIRDISELNHNLSATAWEQEDSISKQEQVQTSTEKALQAVQNLHQEFAAAAEDEEESAYSSSSSSSSTSSSSTSDVDLEDEMSTDISSDIVNEFTNFGFSNQGAQVSEYLDEFDLDSLEDEESELTNHFSTRAGRPMPVAGGEHGT